jgi:HSP20 family molecular chaperone IbpA
MTNLTRVLNPLFSDLESFLETEAYLRSASVAAFPKLDIYSHETENGIKYVVEASLSGYDPNEISVVIDRNRLIISHERNKEKDVQERSVYLNEIKRSSFTRSILLSDKLDTANPVSSYKDGILKIEFSEDVTKAPKKINFLN